MRFDRCAEIDERVDKGGLDAGRGGVAARYQKTHRRAFAAVEIGGRVRLGAVFQESLGDLDGVFWGPLALAFNAVGGDVVEESGAVDRRIEVGTPCGSGVEQFEGWMK